jgi:Ca-activated chloride channel family protein
MEGAAIERARDACATLVDSLGEGDALSIVSFGSDTRVIVPATRTTAASKALAKGAIAKIKAEGTTDMAGGLQAGIAQARTFLSNDGINRIVLVGDGVPNEPRSVTTLADQAQQLHIPITTLGLGSDFDETLMTTIAQHSGGSFHFVEDASHVAKVFEQELSKMQRLVARGTWVEITPGPGVVIDDVVGLAHSPVGRSVRFQIGEMSEGQVRDAIVHVTMSGHHDASKIELLDAAVHYTTTSTEAELVAKQFLGVAASADAKAVTASRTPEIDHQVARVRVADEIVKAIALARGGDAKGARALLDKAAKLATDEGKRFEDAELSAKAKEALSIKKTVASLVPSLPMPVRTGGGPRPMKSFEFASPPSPAAALEVRSAHGDAMRTIQGE